MNITKMLRTALPWGLFIAFSSWVALAKSLPQESPGMTISVFNDLGISANIVEQAEKVSFQVFQESGIRVDWVNCSAMADGGEVACRQPAFPRHLHARIVQRSLNLKNSILGISYLSTDGSGCQVDIFYKGIEELHRETSLDPAIISWARGGSRDWTPVAGESFTLRRGDYAGALEHGGVGACSKTVVVFYQVRVAEDDRGALSLEWPEGNGL